MITSLSDGRFRNVITGRNFFFLLLSTATVYFLLERAGVFRGEPASYREILHSPPFRFLSVLFALHAVVGSVQNCRKESSLRSHAAALGYIAVLVLIAALWTSFSTRFEGRTIRAEKSVFNAFKQDYVPQTLYIGKYAKLPEVGIEIIKIRPTPAEDMQRMTTVHADIRYAGRSTGGILSGTLGPRWPLISDGTLIGITDFGYAAKYTLFDPGQQELESKTLFMNLFPAGAEDYFEAMFLGYVFSLRLYPNNPDPGGGYGTRSLELKEPLYKIRITRHKDIVYNGPLKPGAKLSFDNVSLSVGEPMMWVEISFVRDLGIPVALTGCTLLAAAMVIFLAGQWGNRKKHRRVSMLSLVNK